MGPTQKEEIEEAKRLGRKIFLYQQVNLFTTAPPALYAIFLITSVPADKVAQALGVLPFSSGLLGMAFPYIVVNWETRRALVARPEDQPGERLTRILKLPRLVEMWVLFVNILGTAVYMSWVVYVANNSYTLIIWACVVLGVMVMLVNIWTRIFIERLLMPLALNEFAKNPEVVPKGGGLLWPKQRWYLPYSFGLFIVCTILIMGTVVITSLGDAYRALASKLEGEAATLVQESARAFIGSIWLPLTILGLFMLATAALAALLLAWHQHQGFRAIQDSIEGFVSGRPKAPEWITTDELGDLARITAQAFNKVRQFSLSLKDSASSLGRSAEILDQSNTAQNTVTTRQAASLQQAQVTAQEIRQTSLVAAQKADVVLQQTETIEKLGRDGEEAIAKSISSLQEIREQVTTMASRIKSLGERARQIENITRTVKDLADQSNMLALNAAIEAVRSGEHGKGFGVVAREIRALADQSIQATSRVRQILQDISLAIRSTVEMTEQGVERVGVSVEQVRAFGDSMRKLSSIMQENTMAVRQISMAVNQQNVGISQIFQAINDLNAIMNETMARLSETNSVTLDVRGVASHVSQLIDSYGWERTTTTWQQDK
jgi:methyl-accepting chemotaxis protein